MNAFMPADRQDEDDIALKDFDGEILEDDDEDDDSDF